MAQFALRKLMRAEAVFAVTQQTLLGSFILSTHLSWT